MLTATVRQTSTLLWIDFAKDGAILFSIRVLAYDLLDDAARISSSLASNTNSRGILRWSLGLML